MERQSKVLVVEIGTAWAYTAGFVAGLVSFILGVGGVLQVVLAVGGGRGWLLLGGILLAVAAGGGMVLGALVRYVRRRNEATPDELDIVAIFDRSLGMLCDGKGQPLVPLAQVRIQRKFQLGSSSPALEARWQGESLLLARGNPFAGGITPVEDALRSAGLSVG